MNGIDFNPNYLMNDAVSGDDVEWEVLGEDGEWTTIPSSEISELELEELRLGRGFGRKPARPKPSGSGKAPGGGIRNVLSAASKAILEHFAAPIVVGLVIDEITGEEKLNHPAGSKTNADGSVNYPDGSIAKSDNSITHPDKSVSAPNGVTTYPDGRTFNRNTGLMKFPDGTESQGNKVDGKWVFPTN